jgi:hypothetical protein
MLAGRHGGRFRISEKMTELVLTEIPEQKQSLCTRLVHDFNGLDASPG